MQLTFHGGVKEVTGANYLLETSYKGQVTRKIIKLLPDQKVQLEGKKPVSLKEFRSGHKDFTLSW